MTRIVPASAQQGTSAKIRDHGRGVAHPARSEQQLRGALPRPAPQKGFFLPHTISVDCLGSSRAVLCSDYRAVVAAQAPIAQCPGAWLSTMRAPPVGLYCCTHVSFRPATRRARPLVSTLERSRWPRKRLAAVSALPWRVMRGRSRCRRRRFDAHTSIGRDRARPASPAGSAGRRGAAARRVGVRSGRHRGARRRRRRASAQHSPAGQRRPAARRGPRWRSTARRRPTGGGFPARKPRQAAGDAPPGARSGPHRRSTCPRCPPAGRSAASGSPIGRRISPARRSGGRLQGLSTCSACPI